MNYEGEMLKRIEVMEADIDSDIHLESHDDIEDESDDFLNEEDGINITFDPGPAVDAVVGDQNKEPVPP